MRGDNPDSSLVIGRTLQEYLAIYQRRKYLLFFTFALVTVLGAVITLLTTPTYRAVAYLLVDPPSLRLNQLDASNPISELLSGTQPYKIETQVRRLQGRTMMDETRKKLNVGKLPEIQVRSVRDTDIIEVAAEDPDPKRAAQAANMLLEVYLDTVGEKKLEKLKGALDFTVLRANEAQQELDATETQLRRFKEDNRVVELEKDRATQVVAVEKLSADTKDLQARLAAARSQIAKVQAQLAREPRTDTGGLAPQADPAVQAAENQLASLLAERETLLQRYTPIHEKVLAVDSQIAGARRRAREVRATARLRLEQVNPLYARLRERLSELEATASGLAAQLRTTSGNLTAAQQNMERFPSFERDLARLQRKYDTARANYNLFSTKREDLRLRLEALKNDNDDTMIMEPAVAPTVPARPNRVVNIALAALLGLALGVVLMLLQEYLDDRVNSIEDIDLMVALPNLGVIPEIEEEGLRLTHLVKGYSPVTEAYRRLRTSLNFAAVDCPLRTLALTSSAPGEGKSTTTLNLATVMALDGKRVIVVDADLRRPTVHRLFGISQGPGLSDLLIGKRTLSEVVRPTAMPGVQVITCGSAAPNPTELIDSAAMGGFIAAVREIADIVLFDSPPTLAVADAAILASRVDGVLFVVGAAQAKRSGVREAISVLRRARANLLGVVLNRFDAARSGAADYYGYASYAPHRSMLETGESGGGHAGSLPEGPQTDHDRGSQNDD